MGDSDDEVIEGMIELSGEEEKDENEFDTALPVLPLRNTVLFPGALLPVNIGRKKSLKLVRAMDSSKKVFVAAAQKDINVEDPTIYDLCEVGTTAIIIKVLEMPDGSFTAILQGKTRVQLMEGEETEPYLTARVKRRPSVEVARGKKAEFKALISTIKETATRVFEGTSNLPPDAAFALKNMTEGAFLINYIASTVDIRLESKLEVLKEDEYLQRGLKLLKYLIEEDQFIKLKREIQNKVKSGLDKQQKEYMLQQQIRTIQDELGDNPVEQIVNGYVERMREKECSNEVYKVFQKSIDKLRRMNMGSSEFSVECNYIEAILRLPWDFKTRDRFNMKNAEKQLNARHFGIDNVKERILEHLAVMKLTKNSVKSPILCLYGPPGVGKTSLCKSIAEALGRDYVRMSLGGLHDESEIRGHRRTYVGAMMGQILENLAKAGSGNPVFVLDEIDKVSRDYNGDPASALLEVLDPEQNMNFHDNYLDINYDLSDVLFIATANNISTISAPLLDRLELIEVSGYLQEEKVEIAMRHLLPKQLGEHGLDKTKLAIPKKTMSYVIDKYTRESGVRELDKVIAKLCRKVALEVANGDEEKKTLTPADINKYLGIERFNHDIWQDNMKAGVVTGLAWTAVGGEILFIEANTSEGKGNLTLTGNLGDVMKESAILALEYVRSNAKLWGLEDVKFDETHVHIHVPEGAVPKDGPSAGITMVSALVSALSQRKVKKRYAMTGEITLSGRVLPVGGIKEKMLAAKRAGITDIVLSKQNQKDISEIKEEYIAGLTFHYVSEIPEVIEYALEKK